MTTLKQRLLKILSDKFLTCSLISELKLTDDIEQAVWYTLRDADTDKALRNMFPDDPKIP